MNQAGPGTLVLFEPWSLGDVVIAVSVGRELASPATIACHSRWHPILRAALLSSPALQFLAVDLPYTTRTRSSAFDTTGTSDPSSAPEEADLVLSIRGDPRDFAAARRIFPDAQIRMRGWIRFLARKSAVVNFPYALGMRPAENRYRSWAKLTGVPFEQVEQNYRRMQAEAPRDGRVVVHVGAQWRSKQYPHISELRGRLAEGGYAIILLAGPQDLLPAGIDEKDVTRAVDQELVELLRSAEHVITNDSGPMHLAAFLGCRTTTVVRTSPIEEWLPPATAVVRAGQTPRGYRPHRDYMTDEIVAGWPPAAEIVAKLREADQNVAK